MSAEPLLLEESVRRKLEPLSLVAKRVRVGAMKGDRRSKKRGTSVEFADYRNNVIYNWGNNNVYGGEGGNYNIIANYYKPGPSTSKSAQKKIANPFSKANEISFSKWFIDENVNAISTEITGDNWKGVNVEKATQAEINAVKVSTAFNALNHTHFNATDAFNKVLENAGASYRRDTLDLRIINDVRTGQGRIIDVQG